MAADEVVNNLMGFAVYLVKRELASKDRTGAGAARYTVIIAGRVPIPLFAKVEAELTRIKDEGIIKAVTEPTDWCAHIATVLTKNGGLRVCVDLRKLNETVKRQLYTPPTVEDLASKFAGGKV